MCLEIYSISCKMLDMSTDFLCLCNKFIHRLYMPYTYLIIQDYCIGTGTIVIHAIGTPRMFSVLIKYLLITDSAWNDIYSPRYYECNIISLRHSLGIIWVAKPLPQLIVVYRLLLIRDQCFPTSNGTYDFAFGSLHWQFVNNIFAMILTNFVWCAVYVASPGCHYCLTSWYHWLKSP